MDFLKRRSFIKGFGLGGVIAGSAAVGFTAAKAMSNATPQPAPAVVYPQLEDISHLAPRDTGTDLTLARNNDEPEPLQASPGSVSYTHLTLPTKRIV